MFAEEIIFSKNLLKANTINNNNESGSYLKNNINAPNTLFSFYKNQFGINIKNELINTQNNLLNLMVNNSKPINDKFVVDFESDIQYEKKRTR